MKAADVMSSPVLTARRATPLAVVARLLVEHHIGAAPVVTARGRVIGIIAAADLLPFEGDGVSARCAADVMTADVVTARMDDDVVHLADLMVAHGVGRLPILRGGRLVGIVSRADLLRPLARSDARMAGELEATLRRVMPQAMHLRAGVRDGVAVVAATGDVAERRLAVAIARGVPGVTAVELAEDA
jgi:CBS domain-containing protein